MPFYQRGKHMDIKQRLYNYPSLQQEIIELNKELKIFQELRYETNITSKINPTPSARTNEISDPTSKQIERIEDLYDKQIEITANKIEKLLKEKQYIERFLEKMETKEKRIVEFRYFERKTWDEIKSLEGITKRTLYKINADIKKHI